MTIKAQKQQYPTASKAVRLSLARNRLRLGKFQIGASMVEFVIVTPLIMFVGLGIMQFGLIYHAKSMLNYATFEAARTGAVHNAQTDIMRNEIGYRMAPVFGGGGELRDGVSAIVRSVVNAQDPSVTKIEILNPTGNTFSVHGKNKDVVDSHGNDRFGVAAIPNSHMRVRNHADTKDDGLNIQDANLLKIRVTYGYQMRLPFLDMEVPGVTWTMRNFMIQTDPDNWMYYMRGMLPLKSTATVRMQSEAWDSQLDPIVVRMFNAMYEWTKERLEELANGEDDGTFEGCDPENGTPVNALLQTTDTTSCAYVPPPGSENANFGIDQPESGPSSPVPDSANTNQSGAIIQGDPLVSGTGC